MFAKARLLGKRNDSPVIDWPFAFLVSSSLAVVSLAPSSAAISSPLELNQRAEMATKQASKQPSQTTERERCICLSGWLSVFDARQQEMQCSVQLAGRVQQPIRIARAVGRDKNGFDREPGLGWAKQRSRLARTQAQQHALARSSRPEAHKPAE